MNPNLNQDNNEDNLNNDLINRNNQSNDITTDYDSDTEMNTSSISKSTSKYKFFNLKNLTKRIHSSQIDYDRTKKPKYKGLINEDEIRPKEEKAINIEYVNIFKIYGHLIKPIDWVFIIIAMIGSIGAGISVPLLAYTTSEVYSHIANTSENRDSEENIEIMILVVKKVMNIQIKKQIMNGILAFIFYSLNIC